ncbi:NHLP bacteriocin export ABC transporter permease/ATPase subunit [bacterium D16-51]|nr:NHLP bacteriocin export ABC transporter permease/ATPase subunit [bacterium D16-59]RKI56595.1 NHLP bacteriocin export ABC transporter permease/ATPase subunit [bacterium D16-51]
MGWFEGQIKQRMEYDDDAFQEAFVKMAGAVMGEKVTAALENDRQQVQNAMDEILKFYHVKIREYPEHLHGMNEQLEYVLRPMGIMRRTVKLEKGWYKDATGPFLAVWRDTKRIAALIPTASGYRFLDADTGKWTRVNHRNEEYFEEEAICFYKPLPLRKVSYGDFFKYALNTLSAWDVAFVAAAVLVVTLVGLLPAKLNYIIFSLVIPSGSIGLLYAMAWVMICVLGASVLLGAVKTLCMARIKAKMGMSVQSAVMMRVLSLPASFFKDYNAGELASRVQKADVLCMLTADAVLSTGLTSVFSLIYITQIFRYAPALCIPAVVVMALTLFISVVSSFVQIKVLRKQMEFQAKEKGVSYGLIAGVQKIRLSGAEKRAFSKWAGIYAKEAAMNWNPPLFLKLTSVIILAISSIGTIAMYWAAIKSGVSTADYYAFQTAYGMVSGAFQALSSAALTVAQIKPVMEMLRPVLDEAPEVSGDKQVVTRLSGGIELNNVLFRYNDSMPYVIDNLSLKVRPGEYVAIVGATGCGKSTLMRLLLGFEMPEKGAVYYDGKDLAKIDLKSLRRRIGVVLQDGRLFSGDIFSNIVISAPWLTLDDAWEAAEMSGIAADIRRMPMGMHTVISEGGGGISGGQRQRLLIARAIAPKPKILMFDEATSALDNLTQKQVSEALDNLKCTRIVIAHRLSTIRQCDRIIVLQDGKIIEDGKYAELLELNGYFAQLVARQQVENFLK